MLDKSLGVGYYWYNVSSNDEEVRTEDARNSCHVNKARQGKAYYTRKKRNHTVWEWSGVGVGEYVANFTCTLATGRVVLNTFS